MCFATGCRSAGDPDVVIAAVDWKILSSVVCGSTEKGSPGDADHPGELIGKAGLPDFP
jgi:hypothetical protein